MIGYKHKAERLLTGMFIRHDPGMVGRGLKMAFLTLLDPRTKIKALSVNNFVLQALENGQRFKELSILPN